MALCIGTQVWVPCEVKRGPFSDERMVRVRTPRGEWLGFVPVHALREPIREGRTFIGARVVDVRGEKFSAHLPGQAVTPGLFEGSVSRVGQFDPVQA